MTKAGSPRKIGANLTGPGSAETSANVRCPPSFARPYGLRVPAGSAGRVHDDPIP
jgi:hypothetical protein